MNMWLLIVLFLVVLIPAALAHEEFDTQFTVLQTRTTGQSLQGPMASYFGDETINLYLSGIGHENLVIGLQTENSVVKTVDTIKLTNPDLDFYLSDETLLKIIGSETQATELGLALKEEKITYTAHGFFNKIKYAFIVSMIKRKTQG